MGKGGFWDGIGDLITSITNNFGTKESRLRNKIDQLEREIDELQKKPSTFDNTRKYTALTNQLRGAKEQLQNR